MIEASRFFSCHFFTTGNSANSSVGYEEEGAQEHYYANDYHEEEYSPSPPHASGGSYQPNPAYFPNTTDFPPPPTGAAAVPPPAGPAGFTQHATQSTTHLPPDAPIPPYNPADYANQPGVHDPYGYPAPRTGDNVSSMPPVVPPSTSGASEVPYFPPPPSAPTQVPNEHLRDGGAPPFSTS